MSYCLNNFKTAVVAKVATAAEFQCLVLVYQNLSLCYSEHAGFRT